jgi:hypothetical protein
LASPNPAPGGYVSPEVQHSPIYVPAIILSGPGGPALVPVGGAVDVPALSIGGNPLSALAVNALDSPGLIALTAAGALTAVQSGGTLPLVTLNLAAGFIVTLPAANSVPGGAGYVFVAVIAPTSGNGYEVDPVGADVMRGNGFTPAAAKGARNTQATARIGDSLTVLSDGVSAWYIAGLTGTWARTP